MHVLLWKYLGVHRQERVKALTCPLLRFNNDQTFIVFNYRENGNMHGDRRAIVGREPPEFKPSPPSSGRGTHQEPAPQLLARIHSLRNVEELTCQAERNGGAQSWSHSRCSGRSAELLWLPCSHEAGNQAQRVGGPLTRPSRGRGLNLTHDTCGVFLGEFSFFFFFH